MAKRYTIQDDLMIVEFFDAVGAWNIAMDIGRSTASVTKRAATLRASGGWDDLVAMMKAQREYLLKHQCRSELSRAILEND